MRRLGMMAAWVGGVTILAGLCEGAFAEEALPPHAAAGAGPATPRPTPIEPASAAQPQPPLAPDTAPPSSPPGFQPAADCNANSTLDTIDLTQNLLGTPPSQFLVDAGVDAQSDRRSNIRADDFQLTAATTVVALDVEGREGAAAGDTFTVRFWSAYSVTDVNMDGIADPGTLHPLAVEYSENVPASRITRTLVGGTVFRWNIRLAGRVTLSGSPVGGGTTHFVEVFYTGPAANFWTWERNTIGVASSIHVTQHIPETWTDQPTLNSLRFRLYTARSVDANTNTIPDECEDCNTNGLPDSTEAALADCNSNGLKDTCDIRFAVVTDCNTNGKPDACETGDCDTNGTNDLCDIAAAARDCNTNGIPDACEIQALSAPAFEQAAGFWPAQGFASDSTFTGGGALVRADDFLLAAPRSLGGVSLFGFYLNGAAGNGTNDTFTVRIWTNNASNKPGVIEYTEAVPASRTTRSAYLPNFFNGVWRHVLKFKQPVNLSAGRHWLEIFYTGPAAGDWFWAFLEPTASFAIQSSNVATGETWAPVSNPARFFMTAYVAATDCNTNNTLDLCELAGHDANGDGSLDVCEDCNTNGTADQAEPGYVDCNTNGRLDACDLLAGGGSLNCNTNATPDECETPDCNTNQVPDACDLATHDCNTDGVVDACGPDCNTNGSADVCDLAAGGLNVDCNTNQTLDACGEDCDTNGRADACDLASGAPDCDTNLTIDACDPDCNTNNRPDTCDLARGTGDCNADGFVDPCETAGTLLIASDQTAGTPTGFGIFSDLRRNQVLCDDFDLPAPRKITAVRVSGFFSAPGAGTLAADSFTLRLWSDAGGTPLSMLHSESISGAALTRTGGFTHTLRLAMAMPLPAGKHWLEVIYTGSAPGSWAWTELAPRIGSFARLSTATFPEIWSSVGHDAHWDFQVLFGASDVDTNGIPDECLANPCLGCPGDLNADGLFDGEDIQAFVDMLLTGHSACLQARCADIDQDGDIDSDDAELFAALLASTDGACPARVTLAAGPGGPTDCKYRLILVKGTTCPPGWSTGSIQCIACTPTTPAGGVCPGRFVFFRFAAGDCVALAERLAPTTCAGGCTGAFVATFTP